MVVPSRRSNISKLYISNIEYKVESAKIDGEVAGFGI